LGSEKRFRRTSMSDVVILTGAVCRGKGCIHGVRRCLGGPAAPPNTAGLAGAIASNSKQRWFFGLAGVRIRNMLGGAPVKSLHSRRTA
jgi:hypothetical protein